MNYEAVQGLRRIEGCTKGQEGVFVSRSTLRRTAKKLEAHAEEKGLSFSTRPKKLHVVLYTDGLLKAVSGISLNDLEQARLLARKQRRKDCRPF